MSDKPAFDLVSDYAASGDQPEAIARLCEGIESGLAHQTLLGVTGSGKTFTIANVIARESVAEEHPRQPDKLPPPDRVRVVLRPPWLRQAQPVLDRCFRQEFAVRCAKHPFRTVGADVDTKQQRSAHGCSPGTSS